MTKQEKEELVQTLSAQLKRLKSAVVTEYRGTSVAAMDKVRSRLFDQGIHFRVAKNSLLKRAIAETKMSPPEGDLLDQPIAIASSDDDEVIVAKAITDLSQEIETIVPVAGIVDGRFVGADTIARLAKLPSRDALLGQLAGGLAGLPTKLARTINNPLAGLVSILWAIKSRKEA